MLETAWERFVDFAVKLRWIEGYCSYLGEVFTPTHGVTKVQVSLWLCQSIIHHTSSLSSGTPLIGVRSEA